MRIYVIEKQVRVGDTEIWWKELKYFLSERKAHHTLKMMNSIIPLRVTEREVVEDPLHKLLWIFRRKMSKYTRVRAID